MRDDLWIESRLDCCLTPSEKKRKSEGKLTYMPTHNERNTLFFTPAPLFTALKIHYYEVKNETETPKSQ